MTTRSIQSFYHISVIAVVDNLFNERDRALIYKVPISLNAQPNRIFWNKERYGFYSVRSTYYLLAAEALHDMVSNFKSDKWSCLWRLWLPGRITNFL